MSSSKKKQLRKEQYMTERQAEAAKEAKKLKGYTLTFCVVIALVLSIFVGAIVSNPIKNVIYKNTVAMTVGEHKLSAVEVNYYFIDTVNSYVNQYGDYISLIMDVKTPLDKQIINAENGTTWADSFMSSTENTIKSTYALYDLAIEAGHELTEAEKTSITSTISTFALYAAYYGYNSLDDYLRAVYGNGATEKSYRNYLEVSALANSYMTAYSETLEYTDDQMLQYQANEPYKYNSYTFAYYLLKAESFYKGGVTGEDGKTTYSDTEKAAGLAEAEVTAKLLAEGKYEDILAFNNAIKALEVNKENASANATSYYDAVYDEISTLFQDWLIGKVAGADENAEPTFEERKPGDMTVIPYTTGSGENETTLGYYVVRFDSCTDNNFAMKNVRHILIKFTGGTTNSSTGTTTYSDQEKQAAKEEAESILANWVKNGDLSEESFADLAKEHSDDNAEAGGLYEDIYPGQMVTNFNDWCFDAERKVGDYGIVETEYGYHIMYFVGDSETTFRNYMIKNVMMNEDMDKWYEEVVNSIELTVLNTKHVPTDMALSH